PRAGAAAGRCEGRELEMSNNTMPALAIPAKARLPKVDANQPGPYDRPKNDNAVRVGVIGYGYWGPNIVRNFHNVDECDVVSVCDKSPDALRRVHKAYPSVELTTDINSVLRSPEIDAVAVITPVWTHYELAKAAL